MSTYQATIEERIASPHRSERLGHSLPRDSQQNRVFEDVVRPNHPTTRESRCSRLHPQRLMQLSTQEQLTHISTTTDMYDDSSCTEFCQVASQTSLKARISKRGSGRYLRYKRSTGTFRALTRSFWFLSIPNNFNTDNVEAVLGHVQREGPRFESTEPMLDL